jgi:ATP-dependent helicase YprA (DUF1998 family)
MGAPLKKLNFFVEEDIRKEMEALVPAGQRAKVINEALRKELLRLKRNKVTDRLLALKSKSTALSRNELVEALRKDRKRA